MNSIIRALFYRLPNVGDVYVFYEKDQFSQMHVVVMETKDRWVRYKYYRREQPWLKAIGCFAWLWAGLTTR